MLSGVEYEKRFKTSGPGPLPQCTSGWSVIALFPGYAHLC